MISTESELRNLMSLYIESQRKLNRELAEAEHHEWYEDVVSIKCLQRQCRIMIAQLFETMKNLSVLDEEEIEFGSIKE